VRALVVGVVAAVLLLALPVLAAEPAAWTITRWPATPDTLNGGDIVIGISAWDGSEWHLVGGLTVQPAWLPPACEAVVIPSPEVG